MVWASGFGIGVGRIPRLLGGVGLITMPDVGLDTMQHVEIPPGAGVSHQLVPLWRLGYLLSVAMLWTGLKSHVE